MRSAALRPTDSNPAHRPAAAVSAATRVRRTRPDSERTTRPDEDRSRHRLYHGTARVYVVPHAYATPPGCKHTQAPNFRIQALQRGCAHVNSRPCVLARNTQRIIDQRPVVAIPNAKLPSTRKYYPAGAFTCG